MWDSFQSSGRLWALVENWNSQASSTRNIATLVKLAREYNWFGFLLPEPITPDLEAVYRLLERAFPPNADEEIKRILFASSAAFYDEAKPICFQYLADWLRYGRIKVAVSALRSGTASYQITIVKELGDYKTWSFWSFERNWLEVVEFHKILVQENCVPAAEFLRWADGYEHPSQEDSPVIIAALLQYAFAGLFRTFSAELLEHVEIIRFLRPQMTLEPIPVATTNVAPIAEASSWCPAATIRGICLQTFIPTSLIRGIFATGAHNRREPPWNGIKYKFKLHVPFEKSINMAWAIYSYSLHKEEPVYSSYIWRIICLEVVERAGENPSLLLTYHNDYDALGAGEDEKRALQLIFDTSVETWLVFDTLQLLIRITKLLRGIPA
jgi:hypothetical protein